MLRVSGDLIEIDSTYLKIATANLRNENRVMRCVTCYPLEPV